MTNLKITLDEFKKLATTIKSQTAAKFPPVSQPVRVIVADIVLPKEADAFKRYEITHQGVTMKPTLARDTASTEAAYDLVEFQAVNEFTIDGKIFEKGYRSVKLMKAGAFA